VGDLGHLRVHIYTPNNTQTLHKPDPEIHHAACLRLIHLHRKTFFLGNKSEAIKSGLAVQRLKETKHQKVNTNNTEIQNTVKSTHCVFKNLSSQRTNFKKKKKL